MSEIYVDINADESLNAVAFQHKGIDFIGINIGSFHILNTLFLRMLADRRILPDVGDIDKERIESSGLLQVEPMFDYGLGSGDIKLFPRCSQRVEYALRLSMLAIDFLTLHEIYHHKNGHVALYANRYGIASLVELSGAPTPISTAIRHVIEWDADSMAVSAQFQFVLNDSYPFGLAAKDPLRFYTWAFAIGTLIRLLGERAFHPSTLLTMPYPPPRLRQLVVMEIANILAHGKEDPALTTEFQRQIIGATDDVESTFSLLTGESAKQGRDEVLYAVEALEGHTKEMNRLWRDEVRSMLLPFAHGKLAE